ncbi:unnamed protein product [Parajaminaea phylloscopi]
MSPVPTADNAANPMPAGDPMQAQAPPSSTSQLPSAALDLAARIFDYARNGDEALIQYMEAGVPPNLTNNRGDTLLMLASYHGHTDLVRKMLALPRPPDANQLNGRGQSILAGVVFKGYDELIPVLLEAGADPLAGQPSAEDSAKMFNKWDDSLRQQFEAAKGRGIGARDAAPAVEDREEVRRVPGQGEQAAPAASASASAPAPVPST